MIIKGKQRSGARQLATYLMDNDRNDQAVLLEMSGVAGKDLQQGLVEMEAIGLHGTNATQPLYHAQISPEPGQSVSAEDWQRMADELEQGLGLNGHQRALVLHEEQGREHLHVVWSRVDTEQMKAVNLGHNYRTHEKVSRILEHDLGHECVIGKHNRAVLEELKQEGREDVALWLQHDHAHVLKAERPVAEKSHTEHQIEQRTGIKVKDIAQSVQDAWAASDNGATFKHALEEEGLLLAQGDRRNYVVLDGAGEVHSLSRRAKVKAKEVKAKLADLDADSIPDVETARELQEQLQEQLLEAERELKKQIEEKQRQQQEQALAEQQTREQEQQEAEQVREVERPTPANDDELEQASYSVTLKLDDQDGQWQLPEPSEAAQSAPEEPEIPQTLATASETKEKGSAPSRQELFRRQQAAIQKQQERQRAKVIDEARRKEKERQRQLAEQRKQSLWQKIQNKVQQGWDWMRSQGRLPDFLTGQDGDIPRNDEQLQGNQLKAGKRPVSGRSELEKQRALELAKEQERERQQQELERQEKQKQALEKQRERQTQQERDKDVWDLDGDFEKLKQDPEWQKEQELRRQQRDFGIWEDD